MGWSPPLSLGPLGLLGQSLEGEARVGWSWGLQEGAWVTLLLMSADGPPQGESWAKMGEVGRKETQTAVC